MRNQANPALLTDGQEQNAYAVWDDFHDGTNNRNICYSKAPLEDHRFKSATSAFAEWKRFTRPRRISSCASRSPRCHSSVEKYVCDAPTKLFLRRTTG